MPETAPETAPPTATFPMRTRRGPLLGLSLPQLAVTTLGGVLLLAALLAGGLTGALEPAPLWAALAALVLVRHRGRPLADWAPPAARFLLRGAARQHLHLARPHTRPRRDGLLHLPGTAASLRIVAAPGGGLAAVHDPHAGTLTAVAAVSAKAFALLDAPVQHSHVHGWGRVLAALARTGHLARVQVLERTVPDSGDALQRHWAEHGSPDAPLAGTVYSELVSTAGPSAAPHETYVAVGLDLRAARRLIAQSGGGLTGAFPVLNQLAATFGHAAQEAGLALTGWLTGEQIAAVVRTAYDPEALPALERWSPDGTGRVAAASAGPVVVVEEAERLRTDSAYHAVYWVQDWPRTETGAGFLHQLMFVTGVRRSLSLSYAPKSFEAAIRDVQRRKSAVLSDVAERRRRGQVGAEADHVEYADITARERQLIAGHADVALTGLLVVSARTEEELRTACARAETAAVTAGVDLRLLTFQQAEAFTTAALPLARR